MSKLKYSFSSSVVLRNGEPESLNLPVLIVDTLGTMEDALSIAAELGGIHGKPSVVKETKKKTLFEKLIGDAATEVTKIRQEFLQQPVLQYRFTSPN